MSFCLTLARNRFLHWPTASSMTFCDVSMRRCFKSLVTAAGVTNRCLYNVHTILNQSTNSVVNRTVLRTQVWKDKVRCFLLKELDCFTSIVWHQNAPFPSQLFTRSPASAGIANRPLVFATRTTLSDHNIEYLCLNLFTLRRFNNNESSGGRQIRFCPY